MVIKDAIALFDLEQTKNKADKVTVDKDHDTVIRFFTFLVNADIEIVLKDKRKIPASELNRVGEGADSAQ